MTVTEGSESANSSCSKLDCEVHPKSSDGEGELSVPEQPPMYATAPGAASRNNTKTRGRDERMAPRQQQQQQKTSSSSCCESVTSRWKTSMDAFRDVVSHVVLVVTRHAASHPVSYVVGILLFSFLLLGVGLATNFDMTVNARQQITPFQSLTREQQDWIAEESGFPAEPNSLRILIHNQGDNVVTRAGVNRTFEVVQAIQETDGYEELCEESEATNRAGAQGLCHIRGVPMFWNLSWAIALEQVTSEVNLKLAVSKEKYPDNSTVDPRELMGHMTYYRDAYFNIIESAESFLMEVAIPAHPANARQMAKRVLGELLTLRKDWMKEEDSTFRLEVYLTDHSLESETVRAVFKDVPLIPAVFVVMTIFTCVIFSTSHKEEGDKGYRQRFLLGFGAVATVLLSMVTSYGLMFIAGVPFTSVTQILPFVMFGIGLDDSFIIFGEFVRTDPKRNLVERTQDTFQEVGLSTLLTTATTTAAFGLGALTSVPQLYWLALYAFPAVIIDYIYQITFFVAIIVIDERRIAAKKEREKKGIKANRCCFSNCMAKKQESQKQPERDQANMECDPSPTPFDIGADASGGAGKTVQYTTTDDISSNSGDNQTGNDIEQPQSLVYATDLMLEGGSQHRFHHHLPGPPASAMDRFMRRFANLLMTKHIKILVLFGFSVLTFLCIWSATLFTQEFNIYEVLTTDSYVAGYFAGLEKYADRGFVVPYAYFRNVDQSDPDIQTQMKEYVSNQTEIDSITDKPRFFWLQHFEEFLTYDERLPDLDFNTQMDIFLSVDVFRLMYGDHIVRDPETGDIIASRCMMYMDNLDMESVDNQIHAWEDQLSVTEDAPINNDEYLVGGYGYNFFLHENTMIYVWEFFSLMLRELITTSVLGILVVALITSIFLPHWTAPVFLIPIMVVLLVDMIGFLQFCGVHLNAISHFTLIMSIGLLVDFNMHILLRYYESPCVTRENKVKDALQTMGSSVVVGGLSTFLGVVPLIFSSSSLLRSLFFGFWGMVILGIGHGVILLPVILSYVGPIDTARDKGIVLAKNDDAAEHDVKEDEKHAFMRSPNSICNSLPTSDSSARQHLDSDGDFSGTSCPKQASPTLPTQNGFQVNDEVMVDGSTTSSSPEATPLPIADESSRYVPESMESAPQAAPQAIPPFSCESGARTYDEGSLQLSNLSAPSNGPNR